MKNLFLALIVMSAACVHHATPEEPKSKEVASHKYGVNFGKQKNAITLATGNNNDVDITGGTGNVTTLIRFVADPSGSTLTGMNASTVSDGDMFFLRNEAASGVLTITNQDSLSLAANRFTTANGSALVVPPKTGAIVWYDPTLGFNVFVVASGSPVLSSLKVGAAGTSVSKVVIYAQSLTPTITSAAIQTVQQTFTVTGLATTDKIFVMGPAATSLCPMTNGRVSATNTLQLDFTVLTAAACTPAAGTYTVYAVSP